MISSIIIVIIVIVVITMIILIMFVVVCISISFSIISSSSHGEHRVDEEDVFRLGALLGEELVARRRVREAVKDRFLLYHDIGCAEYSEDVFTDVYSN